MRISYLAPQLSHRIVPSLCSTSSLTAQLCVFPQKGQSKICATLGLAFLGGGFARFRLPIGCVSRDGERESWCEFFLVRARTEGDREGDGVRTSGLGGGDSAHV